MMTKISLVMVLLSMLVSGSNASGNIKRDVQVGIYQNHPLLGLDVDGKPEGFFVDLITEIARNEGWDIAFKIDSFRNNINKIQNNELDLVAGVAYTEDRERYLSFSKEAVCTLWGVIYVQPNSEIQTVLDLDGKTIAVMEKGVYGQNFMRLSSDFDIEPRFVFTESQPESFELLKQKKVDAAIFNNAFKEVYNSEDVGRTSITFSPMKISFVSSKEQNIDLLTAIDKYLSLWKADEHSIYFKLLDQWIGTVEVPQKHIPRWLIYTVFCTIIIIVMSFAWAMALLKNIQQRKIVEEALRGSENRFRSLSDAAFEGILISDEGKISDCNAVIISMFGYSVEELKEMNAVDLVPSEDKEKVHSRILSGSEIPYEVNGITKEGDVFPMEVHAKMFSHQGRQVRVTALRDLSEQKEAAEEIKTLRGILPICSICKNIRNDEGYYEQIEGYIHKHTGVDFSHTICHPCMKEHYPEEYKEFFVKKNSDK